MLLRVSGFALGLCLCVLLAGCQRPSGSNPEAGAPAPAPPPGANTVTVWGADIAIPEQFQGGPNDQGGYEFADGDLALLIGKHTIDPGESLSVAARRHALALGIEAGKNTEQALGHGRGVTVQGRSASEGGSVDLWLLVAPLGPGEVLTLLLVADPQQRAQAERRFLALTNGVRLPPSTP